MTTNNQIDQDLIRTNHFESIIISLKGQIDLIERSYGPKPDLLTLKREIRRIFLIIAQTKLVKDPNNNDIVTPMDWN